MPTDDRAMELAREALSALHNANVIEEDAVADPAFAADEIADVIRRAVEEERGRVAKRAAQIAKWAADDNRPAKNTYQRARIYMADDIARRICEEFEISLKELGGEA